VEMLNEALKRIEKFLSEKAGKSGGVKAVKV
jgi:hypothetical protein